MAGHSKPKPKRGALLVENTLLAFDSLRSTTTRSLLTVMGVFIGVVIIIGVASVLNGFRAEVRDMFERFGATNIYVTRMPFIFNPNSGGDIRRRSYLSTDDVEAIRENCPSVTHVAALKGTAPSWLSAKYKGEEMVGPEIRAGQKDAGKVFSTELREGRHITDTESLRGAPVCILGYNVNEALFPNIPALDKVITLGSKRLRVIGVMDEAMAGPMGSDSPDNNVIYISWQTFRDLFPWEKEVFIAARAESPQVLNRAMKEIEDLLRVRRRVSWHQDNDFEISTAESVMKTFDQITFAAAAVMFALSSVAFIVGGVGVTNVMFASVKERTREIGIRRAVGARRRDIVWQFLTEAMTMTGVGGILGVVIGELLLSGLTGLLPDLPCDTPLWARLFGFFGSVGVGVAFGLWPAITASRLDPINALRYE